MAARAAAPLAEVEVICSDPAEHRRRAAARTVDIAGLPLPDWQSITTRAYESWDRDRIVVDTAGRRVEECLGELRRALGPPVAGS